MNAQLARLEIRIGLREWRRRIPDFAIVPDAQISCWPGGVAGPKTLSLVGSPRLLRISPVKAPP